MIPDDRRPAVTRALEAAFGVSTYDDLRPLTGGLSTALVFRMMVRGTPYLLRVIMRDLRNPDPAAQFACMQLGAGAGIAPRIHYASVEDRILITGFVERQPFPDDAGVRIARVVRTLHELPAFPAPRMGNYLDAMRGLVNRFAAAGLLPADRVDRALALYARIDAIYPRTDLVSSHNDLKPDNIVFDGDRMWLVDWEAAFLNDPYLDLAVVANFFADGREDALLAAYFGSPPTDDARARFALMRQLTHVIYAAFLLLMTPGRDVSTDPVADFGDIHRRLLTGELTLADADTKRQYALVHLDRAARDAADPRIEDALARVAAAVTSGARHP